MVAFVRGAILVFMAILSVQFGGAFAATLIPHVGALGTVALRMSLAALVLAPIVRPHVKGHSRADWMRVLALTIALAGMNTVFYFSVGTPAPRCRGHRRISGAIGHGSPRKPIPT